MKLASAARQARSTRSGLALSARVSIELAFVVTFAFVLTGTAAFAEGVWHDPQTVHVFYDDTIHFTPEDSAKYDTPVVAASENGRVISRTLDLKRPEHPARLTAHVVTRPIPKDVQQVHDKWDRAGDVRLRRPGETDVEIIKFITAYGGVTEHKVDVTHLAPLFDGPCTFLGFVDTWASPGWKMDFWLVWAPDPEADPARWIDALVYADNLNTETLGNDGLSVEVDIPLDLDRVLLHYLVSGHCTDGRGADEFVPKDNVIYVDDREVYRYQPWRDDCVQFRTINPYCRRWSDGSWSSDYSRSGWCPGDIVLPHEVELTAYLTPGRHLIRFNIEGVRPKDEEGHFGYWRVSSYLLGRSDTR